MISPLRAEFHKLWNRFINPKHHHPIPETKTTTHPQNLSSITPHSERGPFKFEILHESQKPGSLARVGRIQTPHGSILTPGFVGVGTHGSMKGLTMDMCRETGMQVMFNNTYHLMVHPGAEVVASFGGLQGYTGWEGPLMTDSGGFQVFSLLYTEPMDELKGKKYPKRKNVTGNNNSKSSQKGEGAVGMVQMMNRVPKPKITEEGVLFRSYRDGKKIMLTPESSVQAQKMLGADIIIPLDELPPNSMAREQLAASLARTHRWQERSLKEHLRLGRQGQAMYGVIHGGTDEELRRESVRFLSGLDGFEGYAIGGSLGANREEMIELLRKLTRDYNLPRDKPIHLLGIADLQSIEQCLQFGFETFDSCYPTRIARHGNYLTNAGLLSIKSTRHERAQGPIDPDCECYTCRNHSLGYLHHLFKTREPTSAVLGTIHNVHFMNTYFARVRDRIWKNEI
eukprot:Nk52_evm17s2506 gene=Nk52_evmTU17s2506